jgi:hypothetical protein
MVACEHSGMADFEYALQRWMLVMLVVIVLAVAAMNYWYRVLPLNVARERTAEQYRAAQHRTRRIETPVVVPAAQTVVQRPQPREEDLDIPVLTLPDGRTLGFAKWVSNRNNLHDWPTTAVIHPWLDGEEYSERISLPSIPSQREGFTPMLLEDGRLALIGGSTPRDVVALESKCADCPDEYIPFGESTPSTTTDVFDFESGTWSTGPTAEGTGRIAIRLRDGRIFKASLDLDSSVGEPYAIDIRMEVADNKFTKWERVGGTRVSGTNSHAEIFESRNGVVMLLGTHDGRRAFHLTPGGKLKPWLEGETWSKVEQLDEGHLQLTQRIDETPPRYQKLIVELP